MCPGSLKAQRTQLEKHRSRHNFSFANEKTEA
jgi:hypothetical protein